MLAPEVVDYLEGAADEHSLRRNEQAYHRLGLLPRVLTGHAGADPGTTLYGSDLPYPVLLAPTAAHQLFHPDAELVL
ncbi:alpha-hydroxy-acid oxidizing protein [Micromonospora sp. RTGN7]|uniref:alpha-hydroxy-acid oxidizing protein n=1 Tax=Micromonospora sp. RTGN7 TaxID=3016526 RepID=UPI0029FEEB72|nr:alpha-hydroxy-acid oxidizing protein [Micromonospora sp. RTGN7]